MIAGASRVIASGLRGFRLDALISFVLKVGAYNSYRVVANIAERSVGAFGADRNTG